MPANDLIPDPVSRKLRIFAFDPGVSAQFNTSQISEIEISVPWEKDLKPGPVGEYIEVVDADPASGCFYRPVDLNDPRLLAQNGLAPSESNPQFHQQMVYAVAMSTIGHFEQALGRVALWATHRHRDGERYEEQFVRRLRIYPHALRDRNAYYSPAKKSDRQSRCCEGAGPKDKNRRSRKCEVSQDQTRRSIRTTAPAR